MAGPGLEDAPEIFPLISDSYVSYASDAKVSFGWSQPKQSGQSPRFHLDRFSAVMGRRQTVSTWPLSEKGWTEAWATLRSDHPEVAAEIQRKAGAEESRRRSNESERSLASEIEAEVLLARYSGWTFLGGYGMDVPVEQRTQTRLFFTRAAIWLFPHSRAEPFLRRPYASTRALEIGGGVSRTGGGYVGGGFGATAAVEGMAIAAVLNSLTTKVKKFTTMRLEAVDAEIFLFGPDLLPKDVEIRLAEPRAHVRAAAAKGSVPAAEVGREQPPSLADQLVSLAGLVEKGLLTDAEFAAAKARLLGEP